MTIIDVQRVSKRYLLHHTRELAGERVRKKVKKVIEPFWALRDISFRVEQGENVAIVGGNGAGKSTLLGIIAGVTAPTRGRLALRGRVGALLEMGTGFHPDLTGRENVHLNASLLGFRRSDVLREFDRIVEFAGLRNFIDEAVRTYSTGMVSRLAFAVAVHVDPDILIMDEVLSVGDESFRNKCQDRIQQLVGRGKTLLFVSHSLPAVLSMCPRAIWLEKGRIRIDGPTEQVVEAYQEASDQLIEMRTAETRKVKAR